MAGFKKLGSLSDIAICGSRAYQVEDRSVLVCHTSKGVFAVENACSHMVSNLEGGKIRQCYISCPLHGQKFDLRDGQPYGEIRVDKPLRTFPVKVENGDVYVRC